MEAPTDHLGYIEQVHDLLSQDCDLPPSTLEDIRRDWHVYQENIGSLVKNALYIIDKKGELDPEGNRTFSGATYTATHNEVNQALTLQHHERGIILRMQEEAITECNFTQTDVRQFYAAACKIEQLIQHDTLAQSQLSPARQLNQE